MRPICLLLIVPLLLPAGCASNNEMKRPFMFKEAKLPAGFPAPGPVGEIIVKEYPHTGWRAFREVRVESKVVPTSCSARCSTTSSGTTSP